MSDELTTLVQEIRDFAAIEFGSQIPSTVFIEVGHRLDRFGEQWHCRFDAPSLHVSGYSGMGREDVLGNLDMGPCYASRPTRGALVEAVLRYVLPHVVKTLGLVGTAVPA